ncbi:outer membrane channel protein TolC [Psychrosphaera sp. B3R10]|uniref:outer membrane channel protein TolC n=1 Tax=unclassified Psychrosphaera TaxID=2641570 RepID=UPI001C08235E|nr:MULTISPECIES: outer membrane channel protein TolC [unclassified Psychrosphaera]MBU2882851.1 outer membrane channel protein TolC [Psychrosphaera sp. I2R16]MBU2990410.1 outer membrane channel protein TolC [Psychrosphaera sp. B3R10]MDO6718617.1 outer membrane channel protein TolC [Psychrosphaera sp. 1_MG-2023]
MRKSFLTASLAILFTAASLPTSATSLLDAYKDAMRNDPATLKAKAQYDIARESEKTAFSGLLPSVSLTGSYTLSNSESIDSTTFAVNDNEYTDLQYGISLSQAIFRMDTWYSLDAAEKRALQAQAGYDLAKQALISRVTKAYFDILKAKDNLEFVQAEKKAIERQLEQTKQRFNVGLTAITDVHEAQAKYDNSVASEIRASNSVEIAKEAIREITGKYYAKFDGLNTERFSATLPKPLKVQQWVTKSENNNLELKAKELVLEATKFDIKRARAGHYPTLTLNASISSQDTDLSTFDTEALNSNSIGLTLNVPLYSGGATSSAVRQAQANYVYASEDREETHRAVVRLVRTSYADVTALVSTIKALEQSVISAESALKATQAGFEVGTRTIVDVLDSTQNLYRAKSQLSSTRYDYILAMMNLKQASGLLTAEDVNAVNSGLSAS